LEGIDYPVNILDFDIHAVPYVPDLIWSSPDCATWSKAAGKTHFDAKSLQPKTDKARLAFKLVDKTIEIINHFLALNPAMLYYIENPEGRLQKYLQASTLFNQQMRLVVIDQCQYGRTSKKPTHIFTNDLAWKPRQRCPGRPMCEHTANVKSEKSGQRSSLGNLDGMGYYNRAAIPQQLIEEILVKQLTLF